MISVIIVGFNSRKYMEDCLSSLLASTYKEFRAIFVDNNSSDDSIEYIKHNFPTVIVINSQRNLGFAGGNNLGIEEAIRLKSDYIFLLNPDTVTDKKCLETLIGKANKNTVLQPLILLHENNKKTNLINTTGNYLNFLGISYCSNYRKPLTIAKEQDIPTASGAAVLIPIEAIQRVGMFDESFFMYHEDVDLFWRMRLAGFNIKLIPEAKIWHKYSFSRNKSKIYYSERNRIIFLLKNFSTTYLIAIFPAMFINEIAILIFSIFNNTFFEKIKSYFFLIRALKSILKKRRLNVSEGEDKIIKKYIRGEIDFSEVKVPRFYSCLLDIYWKIIRPVV